MDSKLIDYANLHQAVSGEDAPGFLSEAGDFFSKGLPLAVGSGVASIWNTGASLGNILGADIEKIDYGAAVADFDDDMSAYYKQHQLGVDLGGVLTTGIVPGIAGIRALKMIQGGVAGTNAAAEVGLLKNTQNLFGIFRNNEAKFIGKATDKIRDTVNVLYSDVTNEKLLAIANGVGQQALEGAAFQTAVLLSMNQSPIFAKPDEDYFTSFVRNSHEILTAGAFQGILGGGLNALSISGKLKSVFKQKEIDEWAAKHSTRVGLQDTINADPGTALSADFAFFSARAAEFEARKTAGNLTDSEIIQYQRSLKQNEDDIRVRLTEEMTIDKDGPLAKGVWNLVLGSEKPVETFDLMLSAARNLKRVTKEDQTDVLNTGEQVFFGGSPLNKRKAENIFNYATKEGKIAPDIFNAKEAAMPEVASNVLEIKDFISGAEELSRSTKVRLSNTTTRLLQYFMLGRASKEEILSAIQDTTSAGERIEKINSFLDSLGPKPFAKKIISPNQIAQWKDEGYVLYKDASGGLHVIEDSAYAKRELPKGFKNKNPTLIVRLAGKEAGRITEDAYPAAGDIWRKIEIDAKTGKLLGDGEEISLPETYAPAQNDALDSSTQYLKAKLGFKNLISKEAEDVETSASTLAGDIEATTLPSLDIAKGNLPLLEAAIVNGFKGEITYGGQAVSGTLEDLLLGEKQLLRKDLLSAGHDIKKIARELNVTEDFAETGVGAENNFLLGKIEDHTKLLFASIDFETSRLTQLPDKTYIQGVASLVNRISLGYEQNQKVVASVLGELFLQLPNSEGRLLNISTIDRHASFLGSASYDYGGFGMQMGQVGKVVNTLKRERTKQAIESLSGLQFAVTSKPAALLEMNQLVNKVRSAKEPLYLIEDDAGKALFLPESLWKGIKTDGSNLGDVLEAAGKRKDAFQITDPDVEAYILQTHLLSQRRADQWNEIYNAMGISKIILPDAFFLPPINARKYSHVALVKEKMDMGTGDWKDAGLLIAPTKENLEEKVNLLTKSHGDRFDFVTVKEHEAWKRIEGEYYGSPFHGHSLADSAIRENSLLYEFQPRTDAEVFNDFNQWHFNQETQIVNQAIELKYAQEFAELRALGKTYTEFATSRFKNNPSKALDSQNPYLSYIKLALDESKFDQYNSLWGKFNDFTEGIAKKVFSVWETAVAKANAGETDWVTANSIAKSYGFTPPYEKVAENVLNPAIPRSRELQQIVAKMNGSISTLTLGLDFLNSLVNVISSPVMMLSEMQHIVKNLKNPELVGELSAITSVTIPGSSNQLPTPMKLMTNAIFRMFGENRKELATFYEQIEAIKTPTQLYSSVIDASSLTPEAIASQEGFRKWTALLNEKAKAFAETGKKVTGYNKSEFMVRFIAADMMKQMTEIAGVSLEDSAAYINSFVNRVHGNYLANQRPHLFQGAVGQAISLFQTYQFAIMQNMVRYIETGDKAAAAMLLGLQNTIFGLQGNPGFYLLNQSIGNANQEHIDITSGVKALVGKDVMSWVMYGLGSNVTQTSLYNRGDLTPRYVTVVPSKIEDIPAISIPYKTINTFLETAGNIARGGDVKASLLNGISHFGLNRPLSGLAQLTQGYRTSRQGNLLTTYNDIDGWTVAAKLAGGEELNRAIAIDSYYRSMAYKAKDQDDRERLGQVVKTTLYNGGHPTQADVMDFMRKYSETGGNPQGFNKFLMTATKYASQTQSDLLLQKVNTRPGRVHAFMIGADSNAPIYSRGKAAGEIGSGEEFASSSTTE